MSLIKNIGLVLVFLPPLVFAEPVNINKAGVELISLALQGIGPKRAAAMVEYRKAHGDFKSLADVEKVKGIGPKIMSAIRQDIRFEDSVGSTVKSTDTVIKFDSVKSAR